MSISQIVLDGASTPKQEEAILQAWQDNPEFGPGQVRSQLRRQGRTISIASIRKAMLANGYEPGQTKKDKAEPKCFEAGRPLELTQDGHPKAEHKQGQGLPAFAH